MANTMLQLGFFQFGLDSAAYQRFTRSTSYRWGRQARLGANDALQFTGKGQESIELEGVIYPTFRGGWGQIGRLRRQADLGIPLPLVTGAGEMLGLFCVTGINEGQAVFYDNGRPRRQEFTMSLERYDGGILSILSL